MKKVIVLALVLMCACARNRKPKVVYEDEKTICYQTVDYNMLTRGLTVGRNCSPKLTSNINK